MLALTSTTAAIITASATPPVANDTTADAASKATGRLDICSAKMLAAERGTSRRSSLRPHFSNLTAASSVDSPRATSVSHRAASVAIVSA